METLGGLCCPLGAFQGGSGCSMTPAQGSHTLWTPGERQTRFWPLQCQLRPQPPGFEPCPRACGPLPRTESGVSGLGEKPHVTIERQGPQSFWSGGPLPIHLPMKVFQA